MQKKRFYKWGVTICLTVLSGLALAHALNLAESVEVAADTENSAESAEGGEYGTDSQAPEDVMPTESEAPKFTPLNPKWSPPNFSGQEGALGWTSETFKVPDGMEERVQFWKDIYTKYNSEQGILHDSKYVSLIYETLDFGDISARTDLTAKQKEKERRKRVDSHKKEIAELLKRLQKVKDPSQLSGDEKRYWEMFSRIDEPKKFAEAARRGRLRFQLGQKDIFARGIFQSGRYLRQMEEIFRQEKLPIELTRLPFVESSFNLKARSRVGASGIWQFMRSTARFYMRMDGSADSRNDPLQATRAAAKKLRENYTMLKTWPLAITAWNHGPAGVRRLTEKLGTTDIVDLIDVRKGRFKFASASFFASFMAALEVEQNADKIFGPLEIMPELKGAEIQLAKNQKLKDFEKWFNGDLELARQLNPHVNEAVWKGQTPLGRRHILRVPLVQEAQARGELN